jgi:hypothetical protein
MVLDVVIHLVVIFSTGELNLCTYIDPVMIVCCISFCGRIDELCCLHIP